ncbi:DUF6049 family protein [Aeromicrobium sp. IC_218]|uniref:DUF6049 family protein n=1 Tax=Aeromicrobium sp. IC_218 TaxID=2545468 RepID=UPI0010406396|nr:DUF6049 family protein [Aeromicrobium sp. IC_218]TCJ00569.1 hypothetical protein E0W78_00275 [Aeromicrobium sp. IC_218]
MTTPARRRLAGLLAVLATAVLALTATPTASAATDPDDLQVRLTAMSQTQLVEGAPLVMSGTVTNRGSETWTDAQAYLVIAPSPFTTRAQVRDAVRSSTAYTGVRVVELDAIAQLGDLAPGSTTSFTLRVPYGLLGVTGADGVYPTGVQVLATDPEGVRENQAVARATTFLPKLSGTRARVPVSVAWPFTNPDVLGSDGTYRDPEALLAAVSPAGRLRHVLDLARTSPATSTSVLDPSLLVELDDLARGRRLPGELELTDAQRQQVTSFRDDLLAFARRTSLWVVDYAEPDALALSRHTTSGALPDVIADATSRTLEELGLSGRRVVWSRGVDTALVADVRREDDRPLVVPSDALEDTEWSQGSVVGYEADGGTVPLVLQDSVLDRVPGEDSVVGLRQWLAAESALASLQRSVDPAATTDAVVVLPRGWDPGSQWPAGDLGQLYDLPWVQGASLDTRLGGTVPRTTATVPATSDVDTLSVEQVRAAERLAERQQALSSVRSEEDDTLADEQLVAIAASARWRDDPTGGRAFVRELESRLDAELDDISLGTPQQVTLSGSQGQFPLTISNDTASPVTVGVELSSSRPGLTLEDVDPVTIDAGARYTLTVQVDVGDQGSSTLRASLVTPDGDRIGTPVDFNVRSSAVGSVLWVAIGLAGLFVVVALVRRFRFRRRDRREGTA